MPEISLSAHDPRGSMLTPLPHCKCTRDLHCIVVSGSSRGEKSSHVSLVVTLMSGKLRKELSCCLQFQNGGGACPPAPAAVTSLCIPTLKVSRMCVRVRARTQIESSRKRLTHRLMPPVNDLGGHVQPHGLLPRRGERRQGLHGQLRHDMMAFERDAGKTAVRCCKQDNGVQFM